MPQPSESIPGIEPLVLPEARQAVGIAHAYLRECILDGRIPPETKLSQVMLAQQLGISRTPLREVLRMLQEEGLVRGEPNQRVVVAGFDAAELDATYGSRIVLECLGVAVTMDDFGAAERRRAKNALASMRRLAKQRNVDAWFQAHGEFHRTLTSAAAEPLSSQLRSLADRSARYIRIGQHLDPSGWQEAGDQEHQVMFEAMVEHDPVTAISMTAHHLERTALRVLADCAPDYVPRAVPLALVQVLAEWRSASVAELCALHGRESVAAVNDAIR